MSKATDGVPFTLSAGMHQYNVSGTGTVSLSFLTQGDDDPIVEELVAPGRWTETEAGCTITPTIPGTAKLSYYTL